MGREGERREGREREGMEQGRGKGDKEWEGWAEADLWFLVPWTRFPDCAPPPSDGPSDDGFQLNLSVS